MNQGKLPVTVVPAASAVLLAVAVLTAFVPGGVLGIALSVLLGLIGVGGMMLWWKVLRNPQAMVQKLIERRGLLEDRAGRGTPQDFIKSEPIEATEDELEQAIAAATEILGGNRAARRAAEAAAKKATKQPTKGSGKRVTPKGGPGK